MGNRSETTVAQGAGYLLPRQLAQILFCFLLHLPILSAQTTVRSVDVHSNEVLSEREILGVLSLKLSSNFSVSQLHHDLEVVAARYREIGRYAARLWIDSLSYSGNNSFVDIFLAVDEGPETIIGAFIIEGNTFFSTSDILERFDTKIGSLLIASRLEQDIDNVLHRYELIGYPFTKISIGNIDSLADTATDNAPVARKYSLLLQIDEGPFVRINEIRVEGNKETKTNVIVRETRLQFGEPYDADKIATIPRRLTRLNIFSSVSEPELYVGENGGGLTLAVQEGSSNTFDGVAGYVPGAQSEQGFFTGFVNVGMRSLFGTGRKLNIRWQREDRFSQEFLLRYAEPWVFDQPVNLGGSFFQRQQDTSYVRRATELKADLLVSEYLSLSALYNHDVTIPSSATVQQLVLNSSTITTGVQVLYDSRDDILAPRSGIYYSSDYRVGRKKIFGLPETTSVNTNLTIQKIGLDVEWFHQTFSRQVVAIGLHGRALSSDELEISDLYRFGGANTVRGYRENQFIGSRVVWSNAEYRFLVARRSFVFGFFDTGYYFRPGDAAKGISATQGVKYGYGIGVRVETGLGNIGVSFALGEGDSFSQAKIHFGLINEF